MRSNELRIGNIIGDTLLNTVVVTIDVLKTIDDHTSPIGEDGVYKPMPLTEEWLLKFGFKNSKSQDKFFVIDNNMGVSTANNEFIFIMGNFVCQLVLIKLQFVHHLQNLYFALTGKELTL